MHACMHGPIPGAAAAHACSRAPCTCMHNPVLTSQPTHAAHAAVVAFSPTVGAALHNALIGILGSILGAGLGILIIALVAALATDFSYQDHPVQMVGTISPADF